MELYLVRHGQSANNILDDQTKRLADPPLTELGQRQATKVAQWLAGPNHDPDVNPRTGAVSNHGRGFSFTKLIASPMLRAMQTAQPISEATGLPIDVWPIVSEVGGVYSVVDGQPRGAGGLTRDQLNGFSVGEVPPEIGDAGWWLPAKNREPETEWEPRAYAAVEAITELWAMQPTGQVLLVSHGLFIAMITQLILGFDAAGRFDLYNTSLTQLNFPAVAHDAPGRGIRMRYANRTIHLTVNEIS